MSGQRNLAGHFSFCTEQCVNGFASIAPGYPDAGLERTPGTLTERRYALSNQSYQCVLHLALIKPQFVAGSQIID